MSKPLTITVTVLAVGLGLVVAYLVGGMRTQVAALEKQTTQQATRLAAQDLLIAEMEMKMQALPYGRGTRLPAPSAIPPSNGHAIVNHEGRQTITAPLDVKATDAGNYKLMRMRTLESARDVLYVMDMHTNRLLAMTFDSGKRKVDIIAGREIKNFDGFPIPPANKFAESSVLTVTIRTDIGEDSLAVVHNASHMLNFYNLDLARKRIDISGSVDLWKVFNEVNAGEKKER